MSLAAFGVGVLMVLGSASAAGAAPGSPVAPSDQALQAARSAVDASASAVAAIEVQLAQQSADSDAADAAAAVAGEAYLRADSERQAAAAAATQAAGLLSSAKAQMEASRRTLVAIALQAARSGGPMDGVQAFLSADGFDDIVQRSAVLSRMGDHADSAVQQFRAAKVVTDTLKEQADQTAADRASTAGNAQTALDAANQAQTRAAAVVAAAQVQRSALIVQLAAARNTTAQIERARQDQIDADLAARVSAAAQAARLAPAGSPASSAGTTQAPGLGTGTSRGSGGQGAAAVAWASTQLNLPYVWGATGPGSYDCSGLTMTAWQHAGLNLPRTAASQYAQVAKISYSALRPGDLIFWGSDPSNPSSVYHVAMWAGNGMIIESPKPGSVTRITSMGYRWASTMDFAGRP